MAEISAVQVNNLRKRTGVSIMACKKALLEAGGDEEKAIEILRKKGEAKAAAKADRETHEGAVRTHIQGGKGIVVSLLCETDFVARNDAFVKLADDIAAVLFEKGEAGQADVDAMLQEAIVTLGENITLGEYKVLEGATVGSYIHLNNTIGALVALDGGDEELAKDVAMHVAAISPTVITPAEVEMDAVEKEKDIYREQLKNEGKPEEMIEKILEGKMNKFREEQALLTQPFVKDPSKKVSDMLGGATVKAFARVTI